MKRTISIILAVIMLLCTLGSISAFAADEKYPPLETGEKYSIDIINNYQYVNAGDNPQPINVNKSYKRNSIIPNPLDREIIDEIKSDFAVQCNVSLSQLGDVDYYGQLSDGSMLVYVNFKVEFLSPAFNYRVIGKYVYVTVNTQDDALIYKDHKFTSIINAYQSGEISEGVLDEVAEILHFAKFVDPNEQPITTEPVIDSVSTPDTPVQNTSGNTALPNNANGSIPTGQSNVAVILSILILCVSVAVFLISKGKKKFL